MKHKLYKPILTLLAICFLGTAFAQKFDKNFTENFTVNKEVEIAINATNTAINVTTWNKNEVRVNAYIEIEGISKEEAQKYFKDWYFEALGNKRKVQITSKGNNSLGLKNDIVFFNNMNFDFEIPEIKMPDMDAIVIPDIDFNFDFDINFDSMEDLEDNMEKEGDYRFEYHNDDEHIVIKSREEWQKFKKSKKYEELKKNLGNAKGKIKLTLEKSKQKIKEIDKKKLKESLEKAKLQMKNINKEEIKIGLEKAREALKNMNFNFNSNKTDFTINGKKVKIKKRLEIKVPKEATFNLNTRHCKVTLPNTVASGNVKYGTFDANNLNGGKLTINYSPVNINSLNACTLFLNNVTDAKIASVTNTTISNNSSDVKIIKINNDVNFSDKFGKITVSSFNPNFGEFTLNLSNSEAILNFGEVHSKFKYQVNKVKLNNERVKNLKNNTKTINLLKVNGEYSSIVIK
ncbi:hypothetical protein JL193_02930 [Polaribacter batillariae]|uniref:Adhesin domain-containing protein n=1 Tax=Polaribacter batillariae TaxID=2808900 RepID=A0ABX7SVJ3_9FLAO|nr:hypothetical protein [Polaribacter batillariae]QTD38272.1 hypothetical protein JL193_02930 [Polaribacter batillariae]